MATYLFAWELGGGLGHILPFRPVAQVLIAKGHRVIAALRDQSHAARAFGDLPVHCLPGPHKSWRTDDRIEPLLSFAHILHNTGWSRTSDLSMLSTAWRKIFDEVRPDAIVCDHSPTALLALRGRGLKHATFGTGFCVPPNETPFPNISPWFKAEPQTLHQNEAQVLHVANEVLTAADQPPLTRLTQLFGEADDQILTTFAELDHYPRRTDARYAGWWPSGAGQPFGWPPGEGPKVYAYAKDFPALVEVAAFLRKRAWPSVIFAPGLLEKLRPLASGSLVVTDAPLDLQQVAREADLVIHNGTHGMTAELLLAGKPALAIPLTMEQAILTGRVMRLGAAMGVAGNDAAGMIRAIIEMLETNRYETAARRFAAKHAAFDPKESLVDVVERLVRLTG